MTASVFYLTYVSTINVTQLFKRDTLIQIRDEATLFNRQHDISGFLYYSSRHFLQYLEGEKNIIETLFTSIQKDPRHHNVRLISQGNLPFRRCQYWHMHIINSKTLTKHHPTVKMYHPFNPHKWHDDKINNFTKFCVSQCHGKDTEPNEYNTDLAHTVKLATAAHHAFILLQLGLVLLALVAFGVIYVFKLNGVLG